MADLLFTFFGFSYLAYVELEISLLALSNTNPVKQEVSPTMILPTMVSVS